MFEAELKTREAKFFGGENPGFVDYMIWPWCERTDVYPYLGEKLELDKVRFNKFFEWKDAMKQDTAVKAVMISGENHYKYRQMVLRPEGPDFDFLA